LFRVGAQIGLKPDEVLDTTLDVLKAMIQGYSDHIFDLQLVCTQAGYWAGYYSRAKKPKSIKQIVSTMLRGKEAEERKHSKSKNAVKPEVDVEAFLEMERQFQLRKNEAVVSNTI
jgi:hypothetical protein